MKFASTFSSPSSSTSNSKTVRVDERVYVHPRTLDQPSERLWIGGSTIDVLSGKLFDADQEASLQQGKTLWWRLVHKKTEQSERDKAVKEWRHWCSNVKASYLTITQSTMTRMDLSVVTKYFPTLPAVTHLELRPSSCISKNFFEGTVEFPQSLTTVDFHMKNLAGYQHLVYQVLTSMATEKSWVQKQYPQLTYRFFVSSSFAPKVGPSPSVASSISQIQSEWRQPPPGWWSRVDADEGDTSGSTARLTNGLLRKAKRSTIPNSTVDPQYNSGHTQTERRSGESTHLETGPSTWNRQANSFSVLLVIDPNVVRDDVSLGEAETHRICPVETNPDYLTPMEFQAFWEEINTPEHRVHSLAQAKNEWNEAQKKASQLNTENLR